MKKILLIGISVFLVATNGHSDLVEQRFESYVDGDLLNQEGWKVQTYQDGEYRDAEGRSNIVTQNGVKLISWSEGFDGYEQARITKRFPETASEKVIVRLTFQPGSNAIGGRLHFDEIGTDKSFSITFTGGRLQIAKPNSTQLFDTDFQFEGDDVLELQFNFDFSKHEVMVIANGDHQGSFQISEGMNKFNRVNFFAGGVGFESNLYDLSVESVLDFPALK